MGAVLLNFFFYTFFVVVVPPPLPQHEMGGVCKCASAIWTTSVEVSVLVFSFFARGRVAGI